MISVPVVATGVKINRPLYNIAEVSCMGEFYMPVSPLILMWTRCKILPLVIIMLGIATIKYSGFYIDFAGVKSSHKLLLVVLV